MAESTTVSAAKSAPLTIKSLLIPLLTHPRVAQFIKYAVYFGLLVNFGLYVVDDYTAFKATMSADSPLSELIKMFSTSIDMSAWVLLIFLSLNWRPIYSQMNLLRPGSTALFSLSRPSVTS